MDAFDTDVLIYASVGDPRGQILVEAHESRSGDISGVGSTLILSEALALGPATPSALRVHELIASLQLVPVDARIATIGAALRAKYHLKTPDALHLATAIAVGADRFVTGNRRDFDRIGEIDIVHPDGLAS
ncbi:type II toxin-antitoxin system VapC family toxin [Aeromicrobium sp. UC242_57]|uniref:type II toxin-antitoxin system VapC family toxin n=1 Tax=Aeromicrobium sp. UC242_57 TaxID=3374624 RepID=UPI0037AA324B